MAIHIKRDGAWLCKKDLGKYKWFYIKDGDYKFSQIHKMIDISQICPDCQKRYYEILDKIPPIVV